MTGENIVAFLVEVGSMHFLRCCNCGGHHHTSKCMERKDAQTADDFADRGAVSQVLGRRGPHFKRNQNTKINANKKKVK